MIVLGSVRKTLPRYGYTQSRRYLSRFWRPSPIDLILPLSVEDVRFRLLSRRNELGNGRARCMYLDGTTVSRRYAQCRKATSVV